MTDSKYSAGHDSESILDWGRPHGTARGLDGDNRGRGSQTDSMSSRYSSCRNSVRKTEPPGELAATGRQHTLTSN